MTTFDSVFSPINSSLLEFARDKADYSQLNKDQDELEDLFKGSYRGKFFTELKKVAKSNHPDKWSKEMSKIMMPHTTQTLRFLWDQAMYRGIKSAEKELGIKSPIQFSRGNALDRELNRLGLSQGSIDDPRVLRFLEQTVNNSDITLKEKRQAFKQVLDPILETKAQEAKSRKKRESRKKTQTEKDLILRKRVTEDLKRAKATNIELKPRNRQGLGPDTSLTRVSVADNIDETEVRERVRTLEAGYPSLSRKSIFDEYLTARTSTVASNLDKASQQAIKQATKRFVSGKNPKTIEDKLVASLTRSGALPPEDLNRIRESVRAQIGSNVENLDIRDLPAPNFSKIIASGIYDKFRKESNVEGYIDSLVNIQNSSVNKTKSQIIKLQAKSLVKITPRMKAAAQKRLSQLDEGSTLASLAEDIKDQKFDVRVKALAKAWGDERILTDPKRRKFAMDFVKKSKEERDAIYKARGLSENQIANLEGQVSRSKDSMAKATKSFKPEDLNLNKIGKAELTLQNLKKQRTEVLTKLAKDKDSKALRNRLASLDKKISKQDSKLTSIKGLVKKDKKLLDSATGRLRDDSKKVTVPIELRKQLAAIKYRNKNDFKKIPAKATYKELDALKESLKAYKANEIKSLNNADRIAATEISAAYNIGRLKVFMDKGVKLVQFKSINDDKRSVFCRSLHNVIFSIDELAEVVAGQQRVQRQGQPFPNTTEPEYAPENIRLTKESVSGAHIWIPPCHPFCRSFFVPVTSKEDEKRFNIKQGITPKEATRLQGTQNARRGRKVLESKIDLRNRGRSDILTDEQVKELIAQDSGLSISQDPYRLYNKRRQKTGSKPTKGRNKLIRKLGLGATRFRQVNDFAKMFNKSLQIIRQETSPKSPSKVTESQIAKRLLLGGGVLTSGALFYFFSKSNLADSLKNYTEEILQNLGKYVSQNVKNLAKEAANDRVENLAPKLLKAIIDEMPDSVSKDERLRLLAAVEELSPTVKLTEAQRMRLIVLESVKSFDGSLSEYMKTIATGKKDPKIVYNIILGDIEDTLNKVEKATKSTFGASLNLHSKTKVDINDIEKLVRYKNGGGRIYMKKGKGRGTFISPKVLGSEGYKAAVESLRGEMDYLESKLSQLKEVKLENIDSIDRAFIDKKIKSLESNLFRLKRFGNNMTVNWDEVEKAKPPKPKIPVATKQLRRIDELISRRDLELDKLKGNIIQADSLIDEILEQNSISRSTMYQVRAIDDEAMKGIYKEQIADTISQIKQNLFDPNTGLLIDPFEDIASNTTLGGILDELNDLGRNNISYEEIVNSLRKEYFDTIESRISELTSNIDEIS